MTLQHVSLEVRREDAPAELRFGALLGFAEVEPAGTLGERTACRSDPATGAPRAHSSAARRATASS
jgi:hypothetical protein